MVESPAVSNEEALPTIRAVVDTIVPPSDQGPGAAQLGVHRHVLDSIEGALPGFIDTIVPLLDAYASELRPDARFADLSPEERSRVLRTMAEE